MVLPITLVKVYNRKRIGRREKMDRKKFEKCGVGEEKITRKLRVETKSYPDKKAIITK